ncbi:general amidase [Cristinia sonorae]|uniref:amidase n=1 Tax=Cristinia sonorae TaxID=1940300 RepID=A0A8K0XQU6_9AGAR|nr:general amidase [Cristinia sonorae]
MSSQDWQTLCAKRKQKQQDSIPREWKVDVPADQRASVINCPARAGILTALELEITETVDVDVLLGKLSSGLWSSVAVTTAFYKRAIIAQQLTNCLTEIFVERALARAKQLDEHLHATGSVLGPLHGLPISLKDQFCMKGLETIMGYASWIGQVSEVDSVLVEILYELGAVPFVRTNVPQTLIWGETYNHVFGRTTNPYNRYMTPGGSSGGEGALVALKGSPIGVGTDIGGSVRIPSAFCGLYTLRPSYERLPYANAVNAQEGQESISSVLGPMANSMSAVKRFTKAVLDAKPWNRDPLVVRKPWSEREYALEEHGGGVGMCFAVMWDNGVVKPHPPIVRAMKIVKSALEDAGHKVIEWESHRHMELYETGERIFAADDGHDYRTECAKLGEPLITTMLPNEDAHDYPLDRPLAKTLVGEPEHLSAYDLWQLHKTKRALRKSYLDHWQATSGKTGTGRPVDAIIAPAVASTACPHGTNSDAFYTTLFKILDYSTSVFPVTFSDKTLDKRQPPHAFRNHEDEVIYNLYDPDLFHGLPVGLQLAGRTQEEEAVIAMTEIVDRAVKAYKLKAQV